MNSEQVTDAENDAVIAQMRELIEASRRGLITDGLKFQKNASWRASVKAGLFGTVTEIPMIIWRNTILPILRLVKQQVFVVLGLVLVPLAALAGWIVFDQEEAEYRRFMRRLQDLR